MPRPKRPAPVDPHGPGGELNVVPFLDILLNVLMFVLATIAVTFTTTLDATPPGTDRRAGTLPPPPLALNVAVLRDGFVVSARGQRLGAGCEAPGMGLAVGLTTGGARDYDGLTACVRRLKTLAPEGDEDVVISAANDVSYDAIISTVDAVRGGGREELFPRVTFGIAR